MYGSCAMRLMVLKQKQPDRAMKHKVCCKVQNYSASQGKVSDNNSEPIIGASVIVKGTTNGAVTDMDGNYSLTNVPAGATIVVSYVGFLPQELVVNSSSMRNISMHEDNKTLEELVVIGYGTQRKADLTGSVANVDASKLNTQEQHNDRSGTCKVKLLVWILYRKVELLVRVHASWYAVSVRSTMLLRCILWTVCICRVSTISTPQISKASMY